MREAADAFDAAELLIFTAQDDATRTASRTLRVTQPEISADFTVLAGSYESLVGRVERLQAEWAVLQSQRHILLFQVIALCLVAFAAPFRLGKSIVDLR